eukprot:763096-Hanusia_phi.AAC.1
MAELLGEENEFVERCMPAGFQRVPHKPYIPQHALSLLVEPVAPLQLSLLINPEQWPGREKQRITRCERMEYKEGLLAMAVLLMAMMLEMTLRCPSEDVDEDKNDDE